MPNTITADEMDTISRKRRPTPEESAAWENYLHGSYAPDLPRSVHDKVSGKAWQMGHSSGYHEVENYYSELIDMVSEVAAVLGYDRTGTYGNQS